MTGARSGDLAAVLATLTSLLAPIAIAGQPLLASVELSDDTVAIGDVFEVRLAFRLPTNRIAYFPDSLETSKGYAPFGGVVWTADQSSDGSTMLSVNYPLLALATGAVTISDLDLFTLPRPTNQEVDSDNLVGSWDILVSRDSIASSQRISVPAQRLWVASVLPPTNVMQGIGPRPPADVWGDNWHWPSAVLITASALAIVLVVSLTASKLVGHPAGGEAMPPDRRVPPRAIALAALDRLLASRIHMDGSIEEFYLQSSDIVRRYIETFDSSWGSAQTCGELMRALNARGAEPPESHLFGEMYSAETVKFGLVRPSGSIAEAHLRLLRDWIERCGRSSA